MAPNLLIRSQPPAEVRDAPIQLARLRRVKLRDL